MDRPQQTEEGLAPLEGEAGIPSVQEASKPIVSGKVFAGLLVILLSIGFAGYAVVHSFTAKHVAKVEKAKAKNGPKAAAEGTQLRQFDLDSLPPGAPRAPEPAPTHQADAPIALADRTTEHQVPQVEAYSEDAETVGADPIGIRTTSSNARGNSRSQQNQQPKASPLDSSALVSLVSNTGETASPEEPGSEEDQRVTQARDRLGELQDSMKGLVGSLQRATAPAPDKPAQPQAKEPPPALGGQLVASRTARVAAGTLGDRSLTLPKGTTFTCALKTRIVSEQSGFISCQVLRNVFSDDGRVLLIDRGSHMDGEYTARYRQGQTRIFVIWSRVRTPEGVTVDIESPATGQLGEAGVDGYVNNHWGQRIGAAMLLTIIDDAVKIGVARELKGTQTIVAQDSGETVEKVAEKILDSTINIPPTIYKNQGEVIGIYVAKDVDFSTVYELRTASR